MKKLMFSTGLNESNRLKRDYLLKKLKRYKTLAESDILEVGIGNGRFGSIIAEEFKSYSGIDPDLEYVKLAIKNAPKIANINYKVGFAGKIPFKKKFDIIFYALSWHFIKYFDHALNEAERLLKKDGIIIILEPTEESKFGMKDSLLRVGSPNFSQEQFNKKLDRLAKGREIILEQDKFLIIEDEINKKISSQFYLLRRNP